MNPTKPLLTAVSVLILAGCSSLPGGGPEADKTYRLTILHTNDHHGRFWKNGDGEYGMAARKTVIDGIRAEVAKSGGYSLLLDGGDINTGVPESDLQDAEPDFLGMNRLGIDAMAVGNHEFDKPAAVLAKQRSWVKFPMLAANIYQRTPQGPQRLFPPYTVFERGGYRIAVMGLTTDDTAKMVSPANIEGIEFRKPIDEAAKLLPELRAQAPTEGYVQVDPDTAAAAQRGYGDIDSRHAILIAHELPGVGAEKQGQPHRYIADLAGHLDAVDQKQPLIARQVVQARRVGGDAERRKFAAQPGQRLLPRIGGRERRRTELARPQVQPDEARVHADQQAAAVEVADQHAPPQRDAVHHLHEAHVRHAACVYAAAGRLEIVGAQHPVQRPIHKDKVGQRRGQG